MNEMIEKLNDVADLLFSLYEDESDKESKNVRKQQFDTVIDAMQTIQRQQAEIERLRQPKWTYASEGMPKYEYYGQKFWVYTQYKKTNGEVGGRQVQLLRWERTTIRGKTVERFKTLWDAVVYDEVIAWMPLKVPEPPMMD